MPSACLDDGAVGDAEHQVGAGGAGAVVAHALGARRGVPVRRVVVVEQRGDLRVDLEDHRPAVAAVAAVGAGERLELLPVDGRTAVPTVTAGRVQHDPVDECHHGWTSSSLLLSRYSHAEGAHRTGAPLHE